MIHSTSTPTATSLREGTGTSRRENTTRTQAARSDTVKIDAIALHTCQMEEVQSFYGDVLGLPLATMERDGRKVTQKSTVHTCYQLGPMELAFTAASAPHDAKLFLGVKDLRQVMSRLLAAGVAIEGGNGSWMTVRDPEGRAVTLACHE